MPFISWRTLIQAVAGVNRPVGEIAGNMCN